jgi:ferredoxin, 2Fe-2S
MANISVTMRTGETRTIRGKVGWSVMENLRDNGFDEILAMCGGSASCATCHVYVDEAQLLLLPAIQGQENDLLDSSMHRIPTSRLSCQIRFEDSLDGLKLTIAPED